MAGPDKILKSLALGLAVFLSVVLDAVFPLPPLILIAAGRRTDRTELILPERPATVVDLTRYEVGSGILNRGAG